MFNEKMKELCVRCDKETLYKTNTPVTVRLYYIEGSGQLCEKCFQVLYPMPTSSVSKLDVVDTRMCRKNSDYSE